MSDFKSKVIDRDLNPYHSFLASFFAGLGEMGLLNQGSVNIVSRRAAEYLYSYMEAKDLLPDENEIKSKSGEELVTYLIDYINGILSLIGKYQIEANGNENWSFLIDGSLCRICPKGVGGAEVKGTLCPVPSFIENLINLMMTTDTIKMLTKGIEKEGTTCKAEFTLTE